MTPRLTTLLTAGLVVLLSGCSALEPLDAMYVEALRKER